MRHNAIRDIESKLLNQVCRDVKTEPSLLAVTNELKKSAKSASGARPDISAVGLWSNRERTFFDILIKHPTADSYMDKSLENIYREGENLKKRSYNQRILETEKATFTPLIFTTTGGMGLNALE